MDRPFGVLFLCTANSARSIIAEAILQREGGSAFRAFSAGSHPRGAVHPHVARMLATRGFDADSFASKSWDEFAAPDAPVLDFVFTVCDNAANEICPVWPGQPMSAHWGVPDPAARIGAEADVAFAFEETWRMLERRIGAFVNLPLTSLDRMSLQRQIDAIGAGADGRDDAA